MRPTAILAALLAVSGAGTALAGPQFTADAVQTQPGQQLRYGKLTVGDNGSRFEFQQAGQPVVQITRPADNKTIMLFPLTRSYIETDATEGAFQADAPCTASDDVECKKEGEETHGDSTVERWTKTPKDGVPVKIWWDAKRKMAVREEYADGRVMQATMRMTMPFNDLSVESWEILYMSPNGMFQRGMQLYAPKFGFAVLSQEPGGVMRELRNVQLGAADAKMFEVPEDYKKIEPEKFDEKTAAAPSAPSMTPPDGMQTPAPAPAAPQPPQGPQGAAPMPAPTMTLPGQPGAMPPAGPHHAMPGMAPPQAQPPMPLSQPPAPPQAPTQQGATLPPSAAPGAAPPQAPAGAPQPPPGYVPPGPFGYMNMPPPFGPYGAPLPPNQPQENSEPQTSEQGKSL